MGPPLTECRLEDAVRFHLVSGLVFVPFVVARLQGERAATDAILDVVLRNVKGAATGRRRVRLRWHKESLPGPLAVQDSPATEWAALGVAFALLPDLAGVRIRLPAQRGDCFDYWVTDGRWQYGLEVSGTMTGTWRSGTERRCVNSATTPTASTASSR